MSTHYTNRLKAASLSHREDHKKLIWQCLGGNSEWLNYKTEEIEYLKSDWTGLANVELATLD